MCSLHETRLESLPKQGFHRVNNRLFTGFVKMYRNYTVIKSFYYFILYSYSCSNYLIIKLTLSDRNE
jgi:hypothetical protein